MPSFNTVHVHFGTAFRSLINESKVRESTSSLVAFSSFVTVCQIDKTLSNLVLYMAVFNLRNTKWQPAVNHRSRVVEITRGSLTSLKDKELGYNARRIRRCNVVQNIPVPSFPKIMHIAKNWSDQSLNRILIKLNRLQSGTRHTIMMNDAVSIKKMQSTLFSPTIFAFSLSEPFFEPFR
jgi:hypothetical protein